MPYLFFAKLTSSKLPISFYLSYSIIRRSIFFVSDKNRKRLLKEFKAFINSSIHSKLLGHYPRVEAIYWFNNSSRLLQQKRTNRHKGRGHESSGDDVPEEDERIKQLKKQMMKMTFIISLLYVLLAFRRGNIDSNPQLHFISWSEFYHQLLAKGEVKQLIIRPDTNIVSIVVHDGCIFRGRPVDFNIFHMNIVDLQSFEKKLKQAEEKLGIKEEDSLPIVYERNQEIPWLLVLFILALLILFKSFPFQFKIGRMDFMSHLTRAKFTIVDSLSGAGKGVKFKDVAGLHEAKIEIMEFVDYLKSPEKYTALGAKIPKGTLLLGPPGCGKTMLAKAVATEANVPFLAMAGSEFIEMIGGLGAARVRDLFKEAKKRAPCIIYIDEIDAIGKKRSGLANLTSGEEEQTLNQLLVEMDGMSGRDGVIMLASTNRHDVLDKALLRPGRFDRHILIDYPTLLERVETFDQHLKPIKLKGKPEDYSKRLAQLTAGFSGADIANVCNEAALNAARQKKSKVDLSDLEYAVERVVGGTEKRTHVMSPQERKVVAYHECGHALVGWLLEHTDALMKVSIVPRTKGAFGFSQVLPSDKKLYSTDEIFDKICMALGGRVSESLIFNAISTSAEDDLKKVTKYAYSQIREYGMDPIIGPLSFEDNKFLRKPYSKKLGALIDLQARSLISKAYLHTEKVLLNNKDKLKTLAEELLKNEVLNYSDIERLIGPPPFGPKKTMQEFIMESSTNNKETKDNEEEDFNNEIHNV